MRLAQIVGGDHRVVELDLDVALAIVVAHFLVAHRDAGGDQRLQAADDDVALHVVFKLRHRHVEAGWRRSAAYWSSPMNLPLGKEHLAGWRRCAGTGARRRRWRGCPACPPRPAESAAGPAAGPPAAQTCPGSSGCRDSAAAATAARAILLHLLLAHGRAGGEQAAVPVGVDHGIGIGGCGALAGEAGDQVHHHATPRPRR